MPDRTDYSAGGWLLPTILWLFDQRKFLNGENQSLSIPGSGLVWLK